MKLNKEEKKRFSKLMDSYLVSIGNSILKLNSEDIRSQRFFSVGHAYDEIISEACFNWFVKQKISDIKFLIKKSKFKISSGRLKHPDKKFNFRGSYNSYEISDSFNEKINKTIKQYYDKTRQGWDSLDDNCKNYYSIRLFVSSINGIAEYNLKKLRDVFANNSEGLPLYLFIKNNYFENYFENKLNSNSSFRKRILNSKNKAVFNFAFSKLNDDTLTKEFEERFFSNPKEKIYKYFKYTYDSKNSKVSFEDAVIFKLLEYIDIDKKNKQSISPKLKYNLSKILCEKFLTLNFDDLEFLLLYGYSLYISTHMRCYLSRKSKPELKKILNSFIEKSKKIENDFANNKLTGLKDEYLNDEYLNKAAVSMYDVLISFKRKIIFNMLKLLDHEDFVFYINEVNQREGNYFLKRMELSKWSFS